MIIARWVSGEFRVNRRSAQHVTVERQARNAASVRIACRREGGAPFDNVALYNASLPTPERRMIMNVVPGKTREGRMGADSVFNYDLHLRGIRS